MVKKITKSSRHPKITGDFAESIVLYFLSRHGFECVKVDHTGIDLIARNLDEKKAWGISVKSRSRDSGREGTSMNIDNSQFEKVERACGAFNCNPYFAIVIDERSKITLFLLPMGHLLKKYPMGKSVCSWKMTRKAIEEYHKDPKIAAFELSYPSNTCWLSKA